MRSDAIFRVIERPWPHSGPRAALRGLGVLAVVVGLLTTFAGTAQATGPLRVELQVWQHADTGEIRIGARLADGSWPAPEMIALPLDDGLSSSGRYRYGDIAIAVEWRIGAAPVTVEIRVWQHVEDERELWISARGSLGSWRTLGTVPLALADPTGSSVSRAGGVTIEAPLPAGETGAPLHYWFEPVGEATVPGSYAFLTAPVAQEITTYEGLRHDAASVRIEVDEHGEATWTFYTAPHAAVITTYEGLRRDAATLRVNAAAAGGASSETLFGAVEAGHLVEWFQARDCFVRYRVTSVAEAETDANYREFGVRPETYLARGCRSGSLPGDGATAAFSTAPETAAAGPFTAVAVGGHYDVCALSEAREAVCWNADAPGATATLPGRYIAIDASEGTTCAVADDGEAVCWGSDASARDAPPGPFMAISTTPGYTCALTEAGAVVCWGFRSERAHHERARMGVGHPAGQPYKWLPDPPPGPYLAITVGRSTYLDGRPESACARKASGGFVCWQAGSKHSPHPQGDVWHVDDSVEDTPIAGDFCQVNSYGRAACGWPGADYAAISDDGRHVCAVTAEGRAECWVSEVTAIAYGALNVMRPPDPSPARYVAISTGGDIGCAITDAGSIACWEAERNVIAPPDPPPGRYVAVSDGTYHTCGLTEDGEAVCWGWNNYGQAAVRHGRYMAVSAGEFHTCALTESGEAVCWGLIFSRAPDGQYATIGAGGLAHDPGACALTETGAVVCWAGDWSAEPPAGSYAALDVGEHQSCVLTEAGEATCWDHNRYGVTDPPDRRLTAVGAGYVASCGLTEDGQVVCWSRSFSIDPPSGRFSALAVGWQHACALDIAGDAVCWGWKANRSKEVPNEPSPFAHQLTRPPPGPFLAISAGQYRSCAVSVQGDIVCWGDVAYTNEPRSLWGE